MYDPALTNDTGTPRVAARRALPRFGGLFTEPPKVAMLPSALRRAAPVLRLTAMRSRDVSPGTMDEFERVAPDLPLAGWHHRERHRPAVNGLTVISPRVPRVEACVRDRTTRAQRRTRTERAGRTPVVALPSPNESRLKTTP